VRWWGQGVGVVDCRDLGASAFARCQSDPLQLRRVRIVGVFRVLLVSGYANVCFGLWFRAFPLEFICQYLTVWIFAWVSRGSRVLGSTRFGVR